MVISDLVLRELQDEDREFLLECRNSFKYVAFCTARPALGSGEEAWKELEKDIKRKARFEFMIIEHKRFGRIGQVFCYRYSNKPADIYITLFFTERFERFGFGVKVFTIYCDYIFQKYKVETIYCEALEQNKHSWQLMRKANFKQLSERFRMVNSTVEKVFLFSLTENNIEFLKRYL